MKCNKLLTVLEIESSSSHETQPCSSNPTLILSIPSQIPVPDYLVHNNLQFRKFWVCLDVDIGRHGIELGLISKKRWY
jgi:hypothetical protein